MGHGVKGMEWEVVGWPGYTSSTGEGFGRHCYWERAAFYGFKTSPRTTLRRLG